MDGAGHLYVTDLAAYTVLEVVGCHNVTSYKSDGRLSAVILVGAGAVYQRLVRAPRLRQNKLLGSARRAARGRR